MFDRAFDLVLGHEGGYVNDADDPGGETKYGISKRQYPNENIKDLTVERAKEIYKRDYWDACKCSSFRWAVALVLFDCAVNQGCDKKADYRAQKIAQRVARVKDDGIIGPRTIAAINRMNDKQFVTEYQEARLRHYGSLPTWPKFGEGWAVRALRVLSDALA